MSTKRKFIFANPQSIEELKRIRLKPKTESKVNRAFNAHYDW